MVTDDKSNTSRPPSILDTYRSLIPEGDAVVSSENDTMLMTSKGGVRAITTGNLRLFARNAHA